MLAAGRSPRVSDAAGQAPLLLVVADPEAYLVPEAALRLLGGLAESPELGLLLPVSNEPWTEEARLAPPFAYLTPTALNETARRIASPAGPIRPCSAPASPVFAARREAMRGLPGDLPLAQVPPEAAARGVAAGIDPGAYLHRYGPMDAQAREDLAARVPAGAAAVLDVGCSRGATAAALRSRGVARVVGIEPDLEDAAAAAAACDHVFAGRVEDVVEALDGQFDAILFGDVLEHLSDPSAALARVRPWLAPGGVVVASVPNVGHAAVTADLIAGRFDYVPYSILSGTHVRFFTRRTISDLFEASGYRVSSIETVTLPLSPEDTARLERLASFPGASPDLSVAEFLVVARADG